MGTFKKASHIKNYSIKNKKSEIKRLKKIPVAVNYKITYRHRYFKISSDNLAVNTLQKV